MILRSLQISGVEAIRFSQQFEIQHDNSSKIIYVQGGRLSSFEFKITSTWLELKDDFSCPECLVEHVRTTMLFNDSTLELTKGKKTIFLLRSVTLRQIHVCAPADGWDTSP